MPQVLPQNRLRHFTLADLDRTRMGPCAGWRQAVGAVFDVAAEPDEIGTFEGELNLWATGRFVLSESLCSRIRLLRTPETVARSRIDHFAIRVLTSGSMAGRAGPTQVEAEAGDLFFIDLLQTIKLQSSIRGGLTQDITLWVPRARLLASISDEHALHGLLLKGTSPAGSLLGACLRSLAAQANHMTIREMDALANGVIELSAHAVAPALEAAAASSGGAAPLASFVTIRRFIDRNLTSADLGTKMIAASFGLSRASLYRLFEPLGGIAGYVRRRRLERAYDEITAAKLANRRIGPIAHRLGFKNVNAFSRAFRSAYGVSPRQAREIAFKGDSEAPLTAEAGEDDSLGRWLMQIAGGG